MDAIRVHPGISHGTSQQAAINATGIPEMAKRDRTPVHVGRQLWTGPQLMARVRATPDHMTVAQAHRENPFPLPATDAPLRLDATP